jgi:hypothetical protein
MAQEGTNMDTGAHTRTYARFITMTKVGTVVAAIVTAVVVLIISS